MNFCSCISTIGDVGGAKGRKADAEESISKARDALTIGAKQKLAAKRYAIEPSKRVVIEFERSDGRVTADAMLRDMSEDGMGLWIGTFIHPNTHCWIMVVSDHGPEFEIEGEVRWCRHFAHTVHEIGISMNRKNAHVLSETLSEQTNKLASDLADITSMIRLVLQQMHPHLETGLPADITSKIYNELNSLVE